VLGTFAANLAKRRGLFRDEFTDDTGWWGIAWLDAYTSREFPAHARQFLAAAEQDADYMHRLAWTRCGAGWHGLQWKRGTPPHMISEATYLELTAGLHNAIGPRDTRYRGWSRQEWSWLQRSRFLTTYPDGITVLDQLDARCKPRTYLGAPMGARTYTQGELIRGLVESARDGARPAPLWAAANRLASWGLTHFSMPRDGDRILVEPCEASDSCYEHGERNIQAFKGVFIHGLRALVALEPSTPRTVALKQGAVRFLAAQAASLIASARADGRVGLHWFKRKRLVLADSTDQASAQEALNAALSWG
jgi:hypothetical protein